MFPGRAAKFLNLTLKFHKTFINTPDFFFKLCFVLDVQILLNYYLNFPQKALEPSLTLWQSAVPLGHNGQAPAFCWAYSHCSHSSAALCFFSSLFQWQSILSCNLVNWALILLVGTIHLYSPIPASALEECSRAWLIFFVCLSTV